MSNVTVKKYQVDDDTSKRLVVIDKLVETFELDPNAIDKEVNRIVQSIRENNTGEIEIGGIEDYVQGSFWNTTDDMTLYQKLGCILVRKVELKLSYFEVGDVVKVKPGSQLAEEMVEGNNPYTQEDVDTREYEVINNYGINQGYNPDEQEVEVCYSGLTPTDKELSARIVDNPNQFVLVRKVSSDE